MKRVYLLKCNGMPKVDRIVIEDMHEFIRLLERYMAQFGPIELLFQEGETR